MGTWTTGRALEAGEYHIVALFADQGADQMLKGLWLIAADGLPPRTHNLVEIAQLLGAPEGIVTACARLTPHYLASRYPDIAAGDPADNYTRAIAEELLASAEEVAQWCSSQLPS